MQYLKPDLHMHSIFSDGTDSVDVIVEKAIEELDIFSLTDHDTIKGCQLVLGMKHPDFITGIEFSCKDKDGSKSHILGYGYDITNEDILKLTTDMHLARVDKVAHTIEFLKDKHGIIFSDEQITEMLNSNSPSHSHVAQCMIANGYVSNSEEAFVIIGEFKGKHSYITPEEAIKVILNAHGIPVLAHGFFEDGGGNLTSSELHTRVKRFKKFGLKGLECFYATYSEAQTESILEIAQEENLLVTAGSDYHGRAKPTPFGDVGPVRPTEEIMMPFFMAISDRIIRS